MEMLFSQWTTDQDIADGIASIGVMDFLGVKFFENRSNGQSKGFCTVSLGSEASMRTVLDQFPKKELHGQNPVVTYTSKTALNQVCNFLYNSYKSTSLIMVVSKEQTASCILGHNKISQ